MVVNHAICVASIPVRPEISDRSSTFCERLVDAERRARGWVGPTPALAELSRLYHANGYFEAAEECYLGLMKLAPREARWPHLHGTILTSFGRLDEALPLLERAVELAPEYVPARLKLADALLKTNKVDRAQQAYTTSLDHDPNNPYALLGLARCDLFDNDWHGARDYLHRAVATDPTFSSAWSMLAMVDERLGIVGAADAQRSQPRTSGRFREAPDAWVDVLIEDCYDPYRLAVAAAISKDPVRARRWLELAIQLSPATGYYHRQLGDLLLRQKEIPSAHRHLSRATELAPDDVDAWVLLFDLCEKRNDHAGAADVIARGLAHCPESPALHFYRGKLLKRAGRIPEAIAAFENSRRLQPNEARAYIELAMIEFQRGRMEQGIAQVQAALVAEPGNVFAIQVMARYAITTHDESTARQWMQRLRRHAGAPAADLEALTQEFRGKFGSAP